MALIGDTEVGNTRQDIVVSLVQETLKRNGILPPTITDYSRFVGPGDKQAKVPRRDVFAAADKTSGSDLTSQALTFSTDDIDLDKHKAIYAEVEMKAEMQSNVNVRAEVIMEQAKELAEQLDDDIITELKLASAAAPDHRVQYANTPTDTIQKEDILEGRRLLNVQNVPLADRFMLISPDQEKSMLQITDFITADKYGDPRGIRNGELGRIYGFTVMMHNGLAAVESIYYHKSAVGWALQGAPDFREDIDLKGVKMEFLLHQVYGVQVLDSGKRQVLFNDTGA